MLNLNKQQLLKKLPAREFWFVTEVANALECCKRSVQYAAAKKGIGKRAKFGKYGIYVFLEDDLQNLLDNLHGRVGRPAKKK